MKRNVAGIPLEVLDFRACCTMQNVLGTVGPEFGLRVMDAPGGGKFAFKLLEGVKAQGFRVNMFVLDNATAPRHLHRKGGKFGEVIFILNGRLVDVQDDGTEVSYGAGQVLFHDGDSKHAPHARDGFVVGIYIQPFGDELLVEGCPEDSFVSVIYEMATLRKGDDWNDQQRHHWVHKETCGPCGRLYLRAVEEYASMPK